MINRMILSLKKAGSSPNSEQSPSGADQLGSIRFARRTIGGSERGGSDVFLGNLASGKGDLPWSYD